MSRLDVTFLLGADDGLDANSDVFMLDDTAVISFGRFTICSDRHTSPAQFSAVLRGLADRVDAAHAENEQGSGS